MLTVLAILTVALSILAGYAVKRAQDAADAQQKLATDLVYATQAERQLLLNAATARTSDELAKLHKASAPARASVRGDAAFLSGDPAEDARRYAATIAGTPYDDIPALPEGL